MSAPPRSDGPAGEAHVVHQPKQRSCLSCHQTFLSEWAGERICYRCKHTSAWRTGSGIRSHRSGSRS